MPKQGFKSVTLDVKTISKLKIIGAVEGLDKESETVRKLINDYLLQKKIPEDVDLQEVIKIGLNSIQDTGP